MIVCGCGETFIHSEDAGYHWLKCPGCKLETNCHHSKEEVYRSLRTALGHSEIIDTAIRMCQTGAVEVEKAAREANNLAAANIAYGIKLAAEEILPKLREIYETDSLER